VGCLKIPSVTFEYCTVDDHSKEMMVLKERFRKAQTLLGTKKIHCYSCLKKKVQTKVFSGENVFSTTCKMKSIK
jgi:hypothetical protein